MTGSPLTFSETTGIKCLLSANVLFGLQPSLLATKASFARRQLTPALPHAWALGTEPQIDQQTRANGGHPRAAEPLFSGLYQDWAKEVGDAN